MIANNIKVPTGNVCIFKGQNGDLEFLSIGDYGKEANVKANFLGLTEDINGVPNGNIMPLEEKWVITISTQYGCIHHCTFCDVPYVNFGGNASYNDLKNQILDGISLHPEVKETKRLNIHYARMGEPTWNSNVLDVTRNLKEIVLSNSHLEKVHIHPVLSTMLPRHNKQLETYLQIWCNIKNELLGGEAGLQFSINSTNEIQRQDMFNNEALSLEEISLIGDKLPMPKGRKYALNFALADDYEIDAKKLRQLFDPAKFMVKITPIHNTKATEKNGISTNDGYDYFTPYECVEKVLIDEGFDVLVFVPSKDEDNSCITCGNAILGGSEIK